MVPASVNDKYVIRFCVVAQNASDDDIGKYLLTCYTFNKVLSVLLHSNKKFI